MASGQLPPPPAWGLVWEPFPASALSPLYVEGSPTRTRAERNAGPRHGWGPFPSCGAGLRELRHGLRSCVLGPDAGHTGPSVAPLSLPPPPAPSGAGAPSPLSVPRPCSRPLPPLKRPLLSNGPQVHADAGPLWQATRERQAATWASEARSWPCPTPGLPPGNSTLSSRAARPGGNAPSPAPPDPTYDAHKRIASRTSDSNALPPLPLPGLPPLLP